jgi:hypothetical protein
MTKQNTVETDFESVDSVHDDMLGRRFLRAAVCRPQFSLPSSLSVGAVRQYAKAAPEPKLHPLSRPIPGELDPRFGDMPQWTVPVVNRQNLTETPAVKYYDQQGRRYYGEPVLLELRVMLTASCPNKTKYCPSLQSTLTTTSQHRLL